ncbi:hypothetical protein FIV49_05115 [Cylindrospermopsis raciborskii GIHE 2018]|nr:hypothetical protein FIV49_05115 [Cylindrospermopsis raciborskii GIHE 2018]
MFRLKRRALVFLPGEYISCGVYVRSHDYTSLIGWVSSSVTHGGVGFHASTQPTFIFRCLD